MSLPLKAWTAKLAFLRKLLEGEVHMAVILAVTIQTQEIYRGKPAIPEVCGGYNAAPHQVQSGAGNHSWVADSLQHWQERDQKPGAKFAPPTASTVIDVSEPIY